MNYAAIKPCDIANGPGCRVVLFVSGCTHRCPGCFQPETWDFRYGSPFTAETEEEILRLLSPAHIAGLTLLGGEPFEPANQAAVLSLVKRVRAAFPEKTVWAFSGYLYEQLASGAVGTLAPALLDTLDVLVDGPFVAALKNLNLRFRGSSNQRVLDLRRTRQAGALVLWDDGEQKGR